MRPGMEATFPRNIPFLPFQATQNLHKEFQRTMTSHLVELCRRRAMTLQNWKPENDSLYRMYLNSMRVPGGLCMKIGMFILNLWYRQLEADGIFAGQEFKVAIEESARVKARCFAIDQDIGVLLHQLSKILSFDLLRGSLIKAWDLSEKLEQCYSFYSDFSDGSYNSLTRSSVREISGTLREISPEIFKVLADDRDKLMFTRLRMIKGKVVAVVGVGHMDGIERLWKLAEDDNDDK
ncbi:Pheromone shutdown [Macleaya cordata]|uniref:Pheromone shutdown n=1 Tax=Macleaya cordata TaxID=56857 RepID=A0A200R2C9_MACCD|nr:Pheromone shutdown [Macleaya cordata]